MAATLPPAAAMFLLWSCSMGNGKKPVAPAGKSETAVSKKTRVKKTPLAGGSYGVLAPEALGKLADDPAVRALQKQGILKVAAPCDRENLCMEMKYGAAVGFEAELIRKIANEALGMKENILPPRAADADVTAAVSCGAPGGPPDVRDDGGRPLAGPYFYSGSTGWLCFRVEKGGRPVAAALNGIIRLMYKTGTFQQVYKNWFIPAAPDIERAQ